ncbi:MAG: pyroglutamyl-peptidase I [Oscillospiraceae bacterium]|nr:pyroglutamyl-peptidase I [Oscillospiraceae bacterium]
MKTLLITGFEPFGGEAVNPSWEAVAALPETIGSWKLEKLRIPVVFGLAGETVLDRAAAVRADAILCVGQAGGRGAVTPELVAINLRHATIPDNAGRQPQDEAVDPAGPAAYFSTLPVRAMVRAATEAGHKCAVSYSAGAYVCNDLLYTVLHRKKETPACFVHVPYLPVQAREGAASMELTAIVEALKCLIQACA